ncbi:type II toxin-antitoxin system RelE/ParE family toxin [Halobacteriovorax sp. XZX-3]|uniref:type II toxin-antitoxin system RelE/ParE family toxin n=1 Tax=unclassified Halobacteriovorax TaxID=2639665 RepID=UPI003716B61D
MIKSINGKITKDIVNKGSSKKFPERLNKRAIFLLMALSDVTGIEDLKKICEPPSLKLHKLKGSMKEFWSITIEKPWCIIFKYSNGEFIDVEIGDYHD